MATSWQSYHAQRMRYSTTAPTPSMICARTDCLWRGPSSRLHLVYPTALRGVLVAYKFLVPFETPSSAMSRQMHAHRGNSAKLRAVRSKTLYRMFHKDCVGCLKSRPPLFYPPCPCPSLLKIGKGYSIRLPTLGELEPT